MGRVALLALLLLAGMAAAVAFGSAGLTLGEVGAALLGGGDPLHRSIVWELRLPRVLTAVGVGGLLGLAGALLQALLRNPLADPYVLGVSGGAAPAALGGMMLGIPAAWLAPAALAGALGTILLVLAIAHGPGGWTSHRLLLAGVAVAAGWGAVVSFLLAVSPDQGLRGMVFWLMGDLGLTLDPWPALGCLALALGLLWPRARALNLLARGELTAASLGVEVPALRRWVYGVASLATAVAVTSVGSVGFVGLVAPHLLRLAGCTDHRCLLPAAALGGALLLVVADTLARSAFGPHALPVGVVTALLGVPLFLLLLHRGRA